MNDTSFPKNSYVTLKDATNDFRGFLGGTWYKVISRNSNLSISNGERFIYLDSMETSHFKLAFDKDIWDDE